MKIQKIAIVGAGIAGLYLAWKLAKKGHQVTVFEKKQEIGKLACSGMFSERIFEFVPQARKLIQNRINSAVIHFPKKTVRIEFEKKFFVMSHFDLDNMVAKLAQKAGAEIMLGRSITSLGVLRNPSPRDPGWLEKFDRIIGCDGANSIVRKSLKLAEPSYRMGIQGFVKREDYSNSVETWPTKNGFIWRIPRGKTIEYGIIDAPKEAKAIFDQYLEKNDLKLKKIQSALIPQGFSLPDDSTVTLCGDAIGLTKPWSGGGVIWSLTAAEMLLKNLSDFLEYSKEMKKFFLPKIQRSKTLTKLVYFLGEKASWLLPKKVKIEGDFLF